MKFGVIVFPGSNCDHDCYWAVKKIGAEVDYIWHAQTELHHYDCLILPGGFSYGDYLRSGAIARFSPVMQAVKDFAKKGGLVIGICNGFQILLESGLLPGAMNRNASLKFICKYVNLVVENNNSTFTNQFEQEKVFKMPIAHNEGNYFVDEETLKQMKENHQIIFRYANPKGKVEIEANPNGSLENIAGITNKEGNVLGMMPHPERAMEAILGSADGRLIFKSILKSAHVKVGRVDAN